MTLTSNQAATVRTILIGQMVRLRQSLDEALDSLGSLGIDPSVLQAAGEEIRRDIAENDLLDSPTGVVDRSLVANVQMAPWYSGPDAGDLHWEGLKGQLLGGRMADAVPEIDRASNKVVAQLTNPNIHGLKKLGMVLGYVQSGKTANFTAVMAKAADRGYGLLIVLSGIHNNLREQTQVRIEKDLDFAAGGWVGLTTADADFVNSRTHRGASLLGSPKPVAIVIKKNASRLQSLRDWLKETPLEIRRRTPVLLLDDEADQATPNSAVGRQNRSAINALIKEIWDLIESGTYVGYTATPFANIFMEPDGSDLYPSNFIINLPRPPEYFGAERLFGREPLSDDDEPDPGLDMIREISDAEAAALRPPSATDARLAFNPSVPESLREATEWFIVATAIRRARGHDDHSSMLIHTTHYSDPHFAMRRQVQLLHGQIAADWRSGRDSALHASYDREQARAASCATEPMPPWDEVADHVTTTIADLRVIVDNGMSEDRLDYDRRDASGNPVREVVIAVGGGTLSRGLTLEGLTVSYFTRTSNTYDTLLQMGRWFGYRPGYEDLPRIWLQRSLADEYRFLALVEAEIRAEIADMELQRLTPQDVGVRVRQHPGRLAIVARNKMGAARLVRVTYAGERMQTFIFDRSLQTASANIAAVKDFISRSASQSDLNRTDSPPRWRYTGVTAENVCQLLEDYRFHPDQASMRSDFMTGWIREAAPDSRWSVTVISTSRTARDENGHEVDLGGVDLGFGTVPAVNRAPLKDSAPGTANIKSLLNHEDWFADLDPDIVRNLTAEERRQPRDVRRRLASGAGQIVIYVVSKNSLPQTEGSRRARREMATDEHLMGLGIIFPSSTADIRTDGTYFGVRPDWQPEMDPSADEVPSDTEGDAEPVVETIA
ncbi:Z1 domain-containing protein [Nocardioides campestrisoli]|uniref:Z1 domain-containing protein n=1 Tax=Nocardioides campestrisoli TaxID=2736757 RepID=UPI0015E6346F|nr:Z1 domain-containing protein [Nocardioides campestrisoli]